MLEIRFSLVTLRESLCLHKLYLNKQLKFITGQSKFKQRYVADNASLLVLRSSSLFFFSSLFPSLSIFTSFFSLIFFGGGTCVTSVFFSVLSLDGILAKKFVMSQILCIG